MAKVTCNCKNETLPCEMYFEIFLKVPVETLMECKMVCKRWYGIIKNPLFVESHLNRSICQRHRLYVLLAPFSYWKDATNKGHKIYSIAEEGELKWRAKEESLFDGIHVQIRPYIVSSCNGLLCISIHLDAFSPVFICNLITRECVKLMAPQEDFKFRSPTTGNRVLISRTDPPPTKDRVISFGYDPLTKNYVLVRLLQFVDDDFIYSVGEILTLGEPSWRGLELPYTVAFGNPTETLLLEGFFYWIVNIRNEYPSFHNILSFNLHTEKFDTIKFPSPMKTEGRTTHLMNLGGHLGLFEMDEAKRCIWKRVSNCWECQHMLSVSMSMIRMVTPIGVTVNDNILFQMYSPRINFRLCLYDRTKKRLFEIEVANRPRSFETSSIVPSLVSPKEIMRGNIQ